MTQAAEWGQNSSLLWYNRLILVQMPTTTIGVPDFSRIFLHCHIVPVLSTSLFTLQSGTIQQLPPRCHISYTWEIAANTRDLFCNLHFFNIIICVIMVPLMQATESVNIKRCNIVHVQHTVRLPFCSFHSWGAAKTASHNCDRQCMLYLL